MRMVALGLLACTVCVSRVAAQDEAPWLIAPTTSAPDSDWIEPTAKRLRAELVDRGLHAWALSGASTRFEGESSAPPANITEEDIDKWVEQSRLALLKLASGEYAAALLELEQVHEFARSAPERLNRERTHSRLVLDNCLYIVRALFETGAESRANAIAREYRTLVPALLAHWAHSEVRITRY
jgi:hypothetical protein